MIKQSFNNFLKYNPLNYDNKIDAKHILRIYYLADVDYTEKVYITRKSFEI